MARHQPAGVMRGGGMVRDENDGAPRGRPVEPVGTDATVFNRRDIEATIQGGGQIVGVALQRQRELDDALPGHAQAAQASTDGDAPNQGSGAAPEASADGDLVAERRRSAREQWEDVRQRKL